MKALYIHSEKDLHLSDAPQESMGDGEVLVAINHGGICGSDLHYYNHGGFGAVRLREPMVLGHEVAGTVLQAGSAVTSLKAGDRVAVSPSRPCGTCVYCDNERYNHCLNMRFYGSAMPFPHIQGAFRQQLPALESQCHKLADGISTVEGAFAEPFAVTLHAANRAGDLKGKRVLITGCGPIGALAIMAAQTRGAGEIVVTDIADGALARAKALGADRTVNTLSDPSGLDKDKEYKGTFDVCFEASGVQAALHGALEALRPGGVMVQLGLGGDITLPLNMLVAKEIELRGTFRFHEEFAEAVDLINQRAVPVLDLLTDTFPLEEAQAAFERANDKSRAMKVQLAF
ncbi:MAG: L-idonate 5-dehydrogenase [Pseudomonadota bacterium]